MVNLSKKIYCVLIMLNILSRSNAKEPLEVRAKTALTYESSFNSNLLVGETSSKKRKSELAQSRNL